MRIALAAFLTFTALEAFGMNAERTRVVLWPHAESIGAQEFMAANESVVDYLATLRRPTAPLQHIAYQCQVKGRATNSTVQSTTIQPGTQTSYVDLVMVYEMSDCTESR